MGRNSAMIQGKFSKQEIAYIKEHYNEYSLNELANKMNRDAGALGKKCRQLGFHKNDKISALDMAKMERMIAKNGYIAIGDKLGYKHTTMRAYASKWGVNERTSIDMLTVTEIARITGESFYTIDTKWRKAGLRIRKADLHKLVLISDLFKFMKAHPTYWEYRKCEKWFFTSNNCKWFRKE